jgi:hypothetical protein
MVRRRVPQRALGHEGIRRSSIYVGKGSHIKLFEKTKGEHVKLHGNRAVHGRHVHAGNVMVTAFHTSTGIRGRMHRTVSGQHQHSATHQEWQDVEREEDKTHQGQVLLYQGQSGRWRDQVAGTVLMSRANRWGRMTAASAVSCPTHG